MRKERVTICIPEDVLKLVDTAATYGRSRSGFVSYVLQLYFDSMLQHYMQENSKNKRI